MLLALQSLDYAILVLYVLAVVLVGFYHRRLQQGEVDFFVAGRSLGWFPAGLSLAATWLAWGTAQDIVADAYDTGWAQLVIPLALWLTLPVVSGVAIPVYRRLELVSVYEYLERRFDLSLRLAASLLFVIWRLFWLAALLYVPCRMLTAVGGVSLPEPLVLLAVGAIGTLYTWWGGLRAVVWTDLLQLVLFAAGLMTVVVTVWWKLEGGPADVWEVAEQLERTGGLPTSPDGASPWSAWSLLPALILSLLAFHLADQLAAQRYLAARSVPSARRSLVASYLVVSLLVALLIYVGLCLLAFYQQHPQAMRPIWVANLDNRTRTPLTGPESGRPLLDWREDGRALDAGQVDAAYLQRLLAEGRLRRPNSKEPFPGEAWDELYDRESSSVRIERLGMRDRRGEWLMADPARAELLAHFLRTQLPMGLAGLFVAGLLAAAMSSLDSGLVAISSVLVRECSGRQGDGFARPGWWSRWSFRGGGDNGPGRDPVDALRLGRVSTLLLGAAVTSLALVVGSLGGLLTSLALCLGGIGGPLLAVFLLGLFSRRATARAVLVALLAGSVLSLGLSLANHLDDGPFLWPWSQRLGPGGTLLLGFSFTWIVGYSLSFLVGRPRPRSELRGLVYGLGKLGVREPREAAIAIEDPERRAAERRWR